MESLLIITLPLSCVCILNISAELWCIVCFTDSIPDISVNVGIFSRFSTNLLSVIPSLKLDRLYPLFSIVTIISCDPRPDNGTLVSPVYLLFNSFNLLNNLSFLICAFLIGLLPLIIYIYDFFKYI